MPVRFFYPSVLNCRSFCQIQIYSFSRHLDIHYVYLDTQQNSESRFAKATCIFEIITSAMWMASFIEVMYINICIVHISYLAFDLFFLPIHLIYIGGKGRTGTRYCMANTYHPEARFRLQAQVDRGPYAASCSERVLQIV